MTGRHIFFEAHGLGATALRSLLSALLLVPALSGPAGAIVPGGPCAGQVITYIGRANQEPPADDDPALTLRARGWIDRVALGDIDRREFSDELNEVLGPEALAANRHLLEGLGSPQRLVLLRRTREGGGVASSFAIQYANCKSVAYVFALGADGKITTLLFAP